MTRAADATLRAPPERAEREPAAREAPVAPRRRLAPLAALAAAAGLCIVAGAYALSRTGAAEVWSHATFWLGYVVIVVPSAFVLTSRWTPRGDRLVLLVVLGLAAYAVKLLHDPFGFTISDEYTHLTATRQILADHRLFEQIPLSGVPVASGYPGLHAVTAALSSICGLSPFAGGAIVIGVARVVLMLGLFLLYERITDSTRLAGIGALLYTASANFVFWSSQFSYESLSLPLFVVTLLVVVSRRRAPTAAARCALTCSALLLIGAVIATHHVTSYALVAALLVLTLLGLREGARDLRAPGLTLAAATGAFLWFEFAAKGTGGYLGFVARRTWDAVADVAGQGTRRPFESAGGLPTPLPEKLLAFGSAALLCAGIAWALHDLWRRRRVGRAPAVVLAVLGGALLVMYPLKLFPGAWESANRASDFVFVGVALLLALAISARLQGRPRRPRLAAGAAIAFVVACVTGGVIQGWPSTVLTPPPYAVRAGDATLHPPGTDAVAWALRNLPRDSTYVADEVTGRELAVGGAHFVLAGRATNVPSLFADARLMPWERELLASNKVDYVVLDKRRISADNITGYYFQDRASPDGAIGYYSDAVAGKFERLPRSRRVLDAGHLAIYDVRGLRLAPPPCADVRRTGDTGRGLCRTPDAVLRYGGKTNIVRLPGMVVRLLTSDVRRAQDGVEVTLVVQVQNTGTRALKPDPRWRSFHLSAGGQRVERERTAGDRDDTLDGTRPIAAGAKRGGSLRFVLEGRAGERALAGDAQLGIASPLHRDPPDVGVLPASGGSER